MGMIFYARRLDSAELSKVHADPMTAGELLYDEGDRSVDLDKAWHAIHFLLTGSDWTTSPGAGEAILGGSPIGEDAGYGPPRLLAPDRVAAVAAGLPAADDLRARYDRDALAAAGIYPGIWEDDDDDEQYVLGYYEDLRGLYTAAATHGDAVLLAIL
ncbi:MAG TPA: YfbM family protein [Pseudonocardiaceae bacterium]